MPSFNLDIDAPGGQDEFHVFVVLDDDVRDPRAGCPKQACQRIKVLVQKATMHGFDARKLASV
jgi:hypothetical protein